MNSKLRHVPLFSAGTRLSDIYEIRGLLGAGAMGQVLDAWDFELGRRVAIKVHHPGVERSVRTEARALAAVRHPAVVSVFATGRHEGVDYVVLEYVPGTPWSVHLERMRVAGTPPPVDESLDILLQVAEGLAAIHRAGLAHGDVKPANILLTPNRVTITDLGLVRFVSRSEDLEEVIAGSPSYMAPEIITGGLQPTFLHLVDVYSLGVTMFEALTGQLPYRALRVEELHYMHTSMPVPRVADLVHVPNRLSAFVATMLAKDPLERPPSMDAVTWQLRAFCNQMSSPSTPLDVLIVEDNEDIARLLRLFVLEGCPEAQVEIANDPLVALERVRRQPPRLMFLDLMMPKMTGFELHAYLRGAGLLQGCAVVVCSAGASDEDVEVLLELGVWSFLEKGPELRKQVRQISRVFGQVETLPPPSSRRA
jgi:eukaryotic-like serine/threonine-protein kinase